MATDLRSRSPFGGVNLEELFGNKQQTLPDLYGGPAEDRRIQSIQTGADLAQLNIDQLPKRQTKDLRELRARAMLELRESRDPQERGFGEKIKENLSRGNYRDISNKVANRIRKIDDEQAREEAFAQWQQINDAYDQAVQADPVEGENWFSNAVLDAASSGVPMAKAFAREAAWYTAGTALALLEPTPAGEAALAGRAAGQFGRFLRGGKALTSAKTGARTAASLAGYGAKQNFGFVGRTLARNARVATSTVLPYAKAAQGQIYADLRREGVEHRAAEDIAGWGGLLHGAIEGIMNPGELVFGGPAAEIVEAASKRLFAKVLPEAMKRTAFRFGRVGAKQLAAWQSEALEEYTQNGVEAASRVIGKAQQAFLDDLESNVRDEIADHANQSEEGLSLMQMLAEVGDNFGEIWEEAIAQGNQAQGATFIMSLMGLPVNVAQEISAEMTTRRAEKSAGQVAGVTDRASAGKAAAGTAKPEEVYRQLLSEGATAVEAEEGFRTSRLEQLYARNENLPPIKQMSETEKQSMIDAEVRMIRGQEEGASAETDTPFDVRRRVTEQLQAGEAEAQEATQTLQERAELGRLDRQEAKYKETQDQILRDVTTAEDAKVVKKLKKDAERAYTEEVRRLHRLGKTEEEIVATIGELDDVFNSIDQQFEEITEEEEGVEDTVPEDQTDEGVEDTVPEDQTDEGKTEFDYNGTKARRWTDEAGVVHAEIQLKDGKWGREKVQNEKGGSSLYIEAAIDDMNASGEFTTKQQEVLNEYDRVDKLVQEEQGFGIDVALEEVDVAQNASMVTDGDVRYDKKRLKELSDRRKQIVGKVEKQIPEQNKKEYDERAKELEVLNNELSRVNKNSLMTVNGEEVNAQEYFKNRITETESAMEQLQSAKQTKTPIAEGLQAELDQVRSQDTSVEAAQSLRDRYPDLVLQETTIGREFKDDAERDQSIAKANKAIGAIGIANPSEGVLFEGKIGDRKISWVSGSPAGTTGALHIDRESGDVTIYMGKDARITTPSHETVRHIGLIGMSDAELGVLADHFQIDNTGTRRELEESIAKALDLRQVANPDSTISGKVKRIFTKIIRALKSLFGVTYARDFNDLIEDIESGKEARSALKGEIDTQTRLQSKAPQGFEAVKVDGDTIYAVRIKDRKIEFEDGKRGVQKHIAEVNGEDFAVIQMMDNNNKLTGVTKLTKVGSQTQAMTPNVAEAKRKIAEEAKLKAFKKREKHSYKKQLDILKKIKEQESIADEQRGKKDFVALQEAEQNIEDLKIKLDKELGARGEESTGVRDVQSKNKWDSIIGEDLSAPIEKIQKELKITKNNDGSFSTLADIINKKGELTPQEEELYDEAVLKAVRRGRGQRAQEGEIDVDEKTGMGFYYYKPDSVSALTGLKGSALQKYKLAVISEVRKVLKKTDMSLEELENKDNVGIDRDRLIQVLDKIGKYPQTKEFSALKEDSSDMTVGQYRKLLAAANFHKDKIRIGYENLRNEMIEAAKEEGVDHKDNFELARSFLIVIDISSQRKRDKKHFTLSGDSNLWSTEEGRTEQGWRDILNAAQGKRAPAEGYIAFAENAIGAIKTEITFIEKFLPEGEAKKKKLAEARKDLREISNHFRKNLIEPMLADIRASIRREFAKDAKKIEKENTALHNLYGYIDAARENNIERLTSIELVQMIERSIDHIEGARPRSLARGKLWRGVARAQGLRLTDREIAEEQGDIAENMLTRRAIDASPTTEAIIEKEDAKERARIRRLFERETKDLDLTQEEQVSYLEDLIKRERAREEARAKKLLKRIESPARPKRVQPKEGVDLKPEPTGTIISEEDLDKRVGDTFRNIVAPVLQRGLDEYNGGSVLIDGLILKHGKNPSTETVMEYLRDEVKKSVEGRRGVLLQESAVGRRFVNEQERDDAVAAANKAIGVKGQFNPRENILFEGKSENGRTITWSLENPTEAAGAMRIDEQGNVTIYLDKDNARITTPNHESLRHLGLMGLSNGEIGVLLKHLGLERGESRIRDEEAIANALDTRQLQNPPATLSGSVRRVLRKVWRSIQNFVGATYNKTADELIDEIEGGQAARTALRNELEPTFRRQESTVETPIQKIIREERVTEQTEASRIAGEDLAADPREYGVDTSPTSEILNKARSFTETPRTVLDSISRRAGKLWGKKRQEGANRRGEMRQEVRRTFESEDVKKAMRAINIRKKTKLVDSSGKVVKGARIGHVMTLAQYARMGRFKEVIDAYNSGGALAVKRLLQTEPDAYIRREWSRVLTAYMRNPKGDGFTDYNPKSKINFWMKGTKYQFTAEQMQEALESLTDKEMNWIVTVADQGYASVRDRWLAEKKRLHPEANTTIIPNYVPITRHVNDSLPPAERPTTLTHHNLEDAIKERIHSVRDHNLESAEELLWTNIDDAERYVAYQDLYNEFIPMIKDNKDLIETRIGKDRAASLELMIENTRGIVDRTLPPFTQFANQIVRRMGGVMLQSPQIWAYQPASVTAAGREFGWGNFAKAIAGRPTQGDTLQKIRAQSPELQDRYEAGEIEASALAIGSDRSKVAYENVSRAGDIRHPFANIAGKLRTPMRFMDKQAIDIILMSAYHQGISQGMTEQQAIAHAATEGGQAVARTQVSSDPANMTRLRSSKNPLVRAVAFMTGATSAGYQMFARDLASFKRAPLGEKAQAAGNLVSSTNALLAQAMIITMIKGLMPKPSDDDKTKKDKEALASRMRWTFLETVTGYAPAGGIYTPEILKRAAMAAGDKHRARRYSYFQRRNPYGEVTSWMGDMADAVQLTIDASNETDRSKARTMEARANKKFKTASHNTLDLLVGINTRKFIELGKMITP